MSYIVFFTDILLLRTLWFLSLYFSYLTFFIDCCLYWLNIISLKYMCFFTFVLKLLSHFSLRILISYIFLFLYFWSFLIFCYTIQNITGDPYIYILWYLICYMTVNMQYKSRRTRSFSSQENRRYGKCEKSLEWIRSVKYSTERRFPHGGFEINFDLPPGRLGRNRWTRSLEILIWMKKEEWKKRVRWLFCVGEWLLPKRIRRDEWRDEIVTKKTRACDTSLCATRSQVIPLVLLA